LNLNYPVWTPIYWLTRKKPGERAAKISGSDFMRRFCKESVALGHRHFLCVGSGVAKDALATDYP
jgi:hypothetical protein